MKGREGDKIKNIGLIGHGGSGKTTLAEAMLYNSGEINRLGRVDKGTCVSDYEPEEIKRKISITTSLLPLNWRDKKINLLDTPGYDDFVGEVKSALRVVEATVLLLCAVSGVEVSAEKTWSYSQDYHQPCLIFINKMDRENADFYKVLETAQEKFASSTLIPLQLPIGRQSDYKGIVDLVKMKAIVYSDGETEEGDLPADLTSLALEYREKLIEAVAETDDALLEKYLEGEELTEGEITTGLRRAVISGNITPVLCGSAYQNIGVKELLDTITNYLPSPLERDAVRGKDPETAEEIERAPSEEEPLSALVFKTIVDPYVGKLNFFRVYTGALTADSEVYNPNKGKTEKIGHIYFMRGKEQIETDKVGVGDLAAVAKLQDTATNDTLCPRETPIVLNPIDFPEPTYSVAVAPKTRGDEEKMGTSLARVIEEDPTIALSRNDETKQMILWGMGETHLIIVLDRLKRKFGVEIETSIPKIPYKETIRASAQAQGKYKRQSGGRGQYGDAWIKIEPLPRGEGYQFINEIVGGTIPSRFIPAVEKGIIEAMGEGVLAGYPIIDAKISLYDGSYHSVDSSDMAFKIAGSMALKKAFQQAKPVLLEPIANVQVIVPDSYMGDIIGDLNSRRGRIMGVEPRDKRQVVQAQVPMAEMSKYAIDLKSLAQGRGQYKMEFSRYEEVPQVISEKIIAEKDSETKGE